MAPLVYLGILCLIGIPGNICVLLIFRKYRHGVYRSLILTIGIVDLLFCIIGVPFNMTRILFYYTFTFTSICQAFVGMIDFGIMVSTHLLLLLSFHRFRQVFSPLNWQIKASSVKYFIVACFVISLGLSAPQIAVLQPLEEIYLAENITGYICAVQWKGAPVYWRVYNFFLTGLFLAYTLIFIVIYSLIGRKIIMSQIERKSKAVSGNSHATSNKMTKISFTVCSVFALSYLPVFINELLSKHVDQSTFSSIQFSIFKIYERVYLLNHVVNCFIYTCFDNHYRKRLKQLCSSVLRLKYPNIKTVSHSTLNEGKRTNVYTVSTHIWSRWIRRKLWNLTVTTPFTQTTKIVSFFIKGLGSLFPDDR